MAGSTRGHRDVSRFRLPLTFGLNWLLDRFYGLRVTPKPSARVWIFMNSERVLIRTS